MPFVLDLLQGGTGNFREVDDIFTRLNEELQLKFDDITAKLLEMDVEVKEKEPPFLKESIAEYVEVAEGMVSVKEKVAAIEDKIRILEKVAASDAEDQGARRESHGGKLDTRDIASWGGPNDQEFYINLNGASQGLGT